MKCLKDIVGVTLWGKRRNEHILEELGEVLVEDQLRPNNSHGLATSKGCHRIDHSSIFCNAGQWARRGTLGSLTPLVACCQ
jgi:hypothetical protein